MQLPTVAPNKKEQFLSIDMWSMTYVAGYRDENGNTFITQDGQLKAGGIIPIEAGTTIYYDMDDIYYDRDSF